MTTLTTEAFRLDADTGEPAEEEPNAFGGLYQGLPSPDHREDRGLQGQ